MTLYELRTYDIKVGQMPTVTELYATLGYPALEAGGFDTNLVGYFISDTGPLHQLVHLWRFDDDAARRDFWKRLFADEAFMAFVPGIRETFIRQHVQLLQNAPWGPHP